MRDYRSLIYQWIKPLRRVKEFKEIAKVEDIEFLRLYGMTDRALLNMFIEYADATGIARMEQIAGVYPDPNDPLETRRARLYMKWNDQKPYTAEELWGRLRSACGEGNVDLDIDYHNYTVDVETRVGGYGVFDDVLDMLEELLPANMELHLHNQITEDTETGIYVGQGTTVALCYEITNDLSTQYLTQLAIAQGAAATEGIVNTVTNDVEAKYSSSLLVTHGTGVEAGLDLEITNDINVKQNLQGGERSLAGMVTTSMVINV